MTGPYRGYHDIGGLPAAPIRRDELPFEAWQKLSEAMRGALEQRNRAVSLDEIRRVFESFGPEIYDRLGFYERRAEALTLLLAEKEIVTVTEIHAGMEALAAARGQVVDHAARAVTRTA